MKWDELKSKLNPSFELEKALQDAIGVDHSLSSVSRHTLSNTSSVKVTVLKILHKTFPSLPICYISGEQISYL